MGYEIVVCLLFVAGALVHRASRSSTPVTAPTRPRAGTPRSAGVSRGGSHEGSL